MKKTLLFIALVASICLSMRANGISVTDNSIEDWNNLPIGFVFESVSPADAAYTGIKSVKVYADSRFINILVELNMADLDDLEAVPFHLFFNADNLDETGGYGDEFADANTDILLEGFVFENDAACDYEPGVFAWVGDIGGDGWDWEELKAEKFCQTQHVGDFIEIQLMRVYVPTLAGWNDSEFGVGFDIQQFWSSVGILPQESPTDENPYGRAHKLQVKIYRTIVDGIEYAFDEEHLTAEVYGIDRTATTITIPTKVDYEGDTYDVVSIAEGLFSLCGSLDEIIVADDNPYFSTGSGILYNKDKTVLIQYPRAKVGDYEMPASVTTIDPNAFKMCTGLTNLTLGAGITSIGSSMFLGCSNLESITIPDNVIEFGESPFEGCENLPVIDNIRYADTYLVAVVNQTLDSYSIKDGTRWIGTEAFAGCANMTSIEIPATVIGISDQAFAYCLGLTTLTVPNSVTYIAEWAFLSVLNVAYDGSALGAAWGARCFNGFVDGWLVYDDDTRETVRACAMAATGDIVLPNSVKVIAMGAFSSCVNINSISLPEGLIDIQSHAFYDCYNLTTIEIPEGITALRYGTFYNCQNLQSVKLPSTLISIGEEAFEGCYQLTSIEIPEGVTIIAERAFYSCYGLTAVTFPSTLETIETRAFAYCSSLQDVNIPDHVMYIGYGAFSNCNSLKSVHIPEGITLIESAAFAQCSSLESVTIPENVSHIGSWAFEACTSLKYVICLGTTPPDAYYSFSMMDCSQVALYVPSESLATYKVSTQWQDFNPILAIEDAQDKKVWPILMDNVTYEQNKDFVVGDLRENLVDNWFYVWDMSYFASAISDLNFYGLSEGYVPLVVGYQGWSGAGYCINNDASLTAIQELKQAIVANPDNYFLHLAIKSSTAGNHQFYTFGTETTSFAIGTATIEQGEVIGDFPRDGQWYEFYVPLNQFVAAIDYATVTPNFNILCFLSGGIAGQELNLDALYFCNRAYKDNVEPLNPTALESVESSTVVIQKILRDGQILILHNGKTYTIMGAEVR